MVGFTIEPLKRTPCDAQCVTTAACWVSGAPLRARAWKSAYCARKTNAETIGARQMCYLRWLGKD
eukprot:8890766-Lingulodinium_polyedra.AAC.1